MMVDERWFALSWGRQVDIRDVTQVIKKVQWVPSSSGWQIPWKKSQDKNWGVGGQREFDENFKCKNSALTNTLGIDLTLSKWLAEILRS